MVDLPHGIRFFALTLMLEAVGFEFSPPPIDRSPRLSKSTTFI
jgi:hypothetical protein